MAITGMTSPPVGPAENGGFDVSEADLDIASRGLKAMGHPLRLKILCILAGADEVSVQSLVDQVGTSQSNISQHLSILRDLSLIHI